MGKPFEIPADSSECPHCGAIFEDVEMKECPVCKKHIEMDATECPNCGMELS
jgi:predicted amidophosphoribosyltransferase